MTAEHRRFWAKALVGDGCWPWTGAKTHDGYGLFRSGRRATMELAHRWAWEWEREPIPVGLTLDHLCRNKACIRLDHLEIVSNRTNILRGENRAAINARKTHCPEGHEYTEGNTYDRPRPSGHTSRICRICQAQRTREWRARRA